MSWPGVARSGSDVDDLTLPVDMAMVSSIIALPMHRALQGEVASYLKESLVIASRIIEKIQLENRWSWRFYFHFGCDPCFASVLVLLPTYQDNHWGLERLEIC